MIRALSRDDLPTIVELHGHAFPDGGVDAANLLRHFEEVFFDGPWVDARVPSLVWLHGDGSVAGFLGVVPRPMRFRGEPIQSVVTTQLLVDPTRPAPVAAARLLGEVFASGYDLVITDGATARVLRLWTALGGSALWLQGLRWSRTLRPCAHALGIVEDRRPSARWVARVLRPTAWVPDRMVGRARPNRFHRPPDLELRPLTAAVMLEGGDTLSPPRELAPTYDERSLSWILDQLDRKRRHGRLRGVAGYDGSGTLVGWYLYYTDPGRTSEVIQVRARPGRAEEILRSLLCDAWVEGASSVRGGMDVALLAPVAALHGRLASGAPWTLAHSPRPDLLAALHRGDTGLSRMDVEFWMRFLGG